MERVRATPLTVEDAKGVGDARGELELDSGVGLRPGAAPAAGFLLTADILRICASCAIRLLSRRERVAEVVRGCDYRFVILLIRCSPRYTVD